MSATQTPTQTAPTGPKRADARRNYELILTAARKAFAEGGESTSLEEIARCAGVGIGTLYRHFPSRQVLLETLYVNEVHEVCRSASQREQIGCGDAVGREDRLSDPHPLGSAVALDFAIVRVDDEARRWDHGSV